MTLEQALAFEIAGKQFRHMSVDDWRQWLRRIRAEYAVLAAMDERHMCPASAPMRQILRVEEEDFWLIVAFQRSEDETEIRAGESAGGTGHEGYPPGDTAAFFG